jgi:hypothetical protein
MSNSTTRVIPPNVEKDKIDGFALTFMREIQPQMSLSEIQILAVFVKYLKSGAMNDIPGWKKD